MPTGETGFDDVTFDLISVQCHSLNPSSDRVGFRVYPVSRPSPVEANNRSPSRSSAVGTRSARPKMSGTGADIPKAPRVCGGDRTPGRGCGRRRLVPAFRRSQILPTAVPQLAR